MADALLKGDLYTLFQTSDNVYYSSAANVDGTANLVDLLIAHLLNCDIVAIPAM